MSKCHLTPSGRWWLRSVPLSSGRALLSQCYSSPTLWVALGTAVLDLFCIEPGPIVYLMGRIRRPTQGAGRGSSCDALVGSQFRRSYDVTWSDRLKGNVSVTYVTLSSMKDGTETSRPSFHNCWTTAEWPGHRLGELMRCTCCLLYSRCDQRQLDANYRMPKSIGSSSYTWSG